MKFTALAVFLMTGRSANAGVGINCRRDCDAAFDSCTELCYNEYGHERHQGQLGSRWSEMCRDNKQKHYIEDNPNYQYFYESCQRERIRLYAVCNEECGDGCYAACNHGRRKLSGDSRSLSSFSDIWTDGRVSRCKRSEYHIGVALGQGHLFLVASPAVDETCPSILADAFVSEDFETYITFVDAPIKDNVDFDDTDSIDYLFFDRKVKLDDFLNEVSNIEHDRIKDIESQEYDTNLDLVTNNCSTFVLKGLKGLGIDLEENRKIMKDFFVLKYMKCDECMDEMRGQYSRIWFWLKGEKGALNNVVDINIDKVIAA